MVGRLYGLGKLVDSAGRIGHGDGRERGGFRGGANGGEGRVEEERDEEVDVTLADGLDGVIGQRPLVVEVSQGF